MSGSKPHLVRDQKHFCSGRWERPDAVVRSQHKVIEDQCTCGVILTGGGDKSNCVRKKRFQALEEAFQADIPDTRFVAYLQLHEFETLLFADPTALRISYNSIDAAVTRLSRMAEEAGDIEKINDSKDTAPSKRIIQQIPHYENDKTTVGPDVAEFIGMEKLMIACEHFRDWVTTVSSRLQQL